MLFYYTMCNSSLNELRTRGQNLFIYTNHNFFKLFDGKLDHLKDLECQVHFMYSIFYIYKLLKKKKNYKLLNYFQISIFPRGLFSR